MLSVVRTSLVAGSRYGDFSFREHKKASAGDARSIGAKKRQPRVVAVLEARGCRLPGWEVAGSVVWGLLTLQERIQQRRSS